MRGQGSGGQRPRFFLASLQVRTALSSWRGLHPRRDRSSDSQIYLSFGNYRRRAPAALPAVTASCGGAVRGRGSPASQIDGQSVLPVNPPGFSPGPARSLTPRGFLSACFITGSCGNKNLCRGRMRMRSPSTNVNNKTQMSYVNYLYIHKMQACPVLAGCCLPLGLGASRTVSSSGSRLHSQIIAGL